ncbi:hypothetical protein Poli38472_003851 [Pythium oligandrum]|uniref:Centrosomal protein of 70 kDa n=1 Tax=Pythium oligandrum TaxID=41045 RepID=A0A8K1CNX8_PYTOL|nr:hypothetical protein Poli38472_003851 [Pythium oligandrum]|eukprot:TMW66086.1 hypothetical protein Poli38472_003851 [Pythium oligandrum]
MEATTTQSAADDEEDMLRMQYQQQQRLSSAFSSSSVDQFLRDNGFQIDGVLADDDVLSSSADDDDTIEREQMHEPTPSESSSLHLRDGLETLLRVDPEERRGDREEEQLSSDSGHHDSDSVVSSAAAGDEGDRPTPRFILLEDEDLRSVEHETRKSDEQRHQRPLISPPASSTVSRPPHVFTNPDTWTLSRDWRALESPMARQLPAASAAPIPTRVPTPPARREHAENDQNASFDRSLLFGGSQLSALSEESNLSDIGRIHRAQDTTEPSRNEPARVPSTPARRQRVASFSSSSTNGSVRVLDDELSDVLGVRASSLAARESSSGLSSLYSRDHAEGDEEEKRDESNRRQPSNPWRGGGNETTPESQRSDWGDVNILLRKNGLPTIQLNGVVVVDTATGRTVTKVVPEHASLITIVQDFVLQLDRKNQIIQDLVIDSNRSSKAQTRTEDDLASNEKKQEDLRNALQSAQSEISRLQEQARREKEATDRQVKTLKSANLKLQQQLKVSEHRVKAKEVLVERMQKKLQQQVDKESLTKARDRKVFRNLQQRDPRKTNVKDNQSLECISIYETQKEQMEEEIEHLRNQVAALNSEVRDKENALARRASVSSSSVHWATKSDHESIHSGNHKPSGFSASAIGDEMLERLEAARREQEQAAAKLRQREKIMLKKISAIEEELLTARDTIAELKDENANLTMEAESRPSIRDYRLCQRRIHLLERQLSENRLALEEANDINELRRFMGTTDLIERDRLNHRLHLNRLNTLPRETLLDVVKEVCRVLNLADITLITPSLHKLCNVVTAVPRMEKFIRDVCGFVYFHVDGGNGNQAEENRFELEQVLPTLQLWMSERKKLHELEGFKTAIVAELCKRSIEPSLLDKEKASADTTTALSNLPRAVHMVSELVELEKGVMHHREIYTQAATELERRPSVLINQIVRHFSHLFHVKSIEGVLPKINEVYLYVNEMENFLKVVRSVLDLRPDTSVASCLSAIQERVERETSTPPQDRTRRREEPVGLDDVGHENFVVDRKQSAAAGGVAGVRQVREMTILIRDLKKELGAATIHEILPRTKRLMELLSLSLHQTHGQEDDDDDTE